MQYLIVGNSAGGAFGGPVDQDPGQEGRNLPLFRRVLPVLFTPPAYLLHRREAQEMAAL